MSPVGVGEGPQALHAGRRWVIVVTTSAMLAVAAIAAVLVSAGHSQATCSSATSPLGVFASQSQLPRLCDLGAPSRLIGSGRVDGVRWRVVVTPPRPWAVYRAAGFGLPANMSGREGSCVIEVVSRPLGYFSDPCSQWKPLGPVQPGHFLGSSCDREVIVVCDASVQRHADHFLLLLAGGGKLMLRSVTFRGRSFVAFALPVGQPVISLTAYASSGRRLASAGSLLPR